MPNYVDVDGKKFIQLDDGSIVPTTAVLAIDGGFPVKLPDAQLTQIRTITFPANYPLPQTQIDSLKSVAITNFPSSFNVSNFPSSFNVSNLPATYPLPTDQSSKLDTISATVSGWRTGSGTIDANTLRVTIATNQPALAVNLPRCASATSASISASTTAVSLAAANANRLFCSVYNDSTAILYVGIGFTPTTTNFTIEIRQDGYFEIPDTVAGLAINGIWASATGAARVTLGIV